MRVWILKIVAAATLVVTSSSFLAVGIADARVPVSPGDTLIQGKNRCTLGYVHRWHGHTVGLTAGHCAEDGKTGMRVVDRDARVWGTSVGVSVVTESQDWQLIDFGDTAWSQRIRTTPYWVTSHRAPRTGQAICHYGVGSDAVSCGTTMDVLGSAISVTAAGEPGDSGGPCFVLVGADEATVVGLWHGHDVDAPGLGYCVSVDAALRAFGQDAGAVSG